MNKDVIYIDTEDDITAIIGKIKDSKEKIVALVPPKRIGVLQSAVNLRLLARMAENSDKRLVLVTNNKALINLSSVAQIPIARNLQSKPELAEIDVLEVDDGEDIIDGKQLPIGELAKTADINEDEEEEIIDVISTIDVEKDSPKVLSTKKTVEKSNVKIPDFSRFRKRLFIGVFVGIGLIAFLVWAIVFAPAAKVIITAKTSPAPVSLSVKLGGTAATDISKGIIQTVTKQLKKDVSVTFTATGQKDLGAKAAGSVAIRNCDYSDGFTLPSGTKFTTSDSQVFVSTASVTVPKFTGLPSACTLSGSTSGKATVAIQASASGSTYNNDGVSYLIDGIPSSARVDAQGTAMTGGTTRMTTVVIADDIQKAKQALSDLSNDSVKQQLTSEFTNGESVISDSFTVVHADAVSAPALDAEATSNATLTSATTFSITAIAKSEIETYLKDAVTKQLDGSDQRIYSDGIDKIVLSGYLSTDQGATVNIAATGQIGPNINDASVKQQVKGKQFGDAQALIDNIKGVNNVDIKFSYFWVTTVPNDVNKIDVQFILQNA
jgi:hypothetical protein